MRANAALTEIAGKPEAKGRGDLPSRSTMRSLSKSPRHKRRSHLARNSEIVTIAARPGRCSVMNRTLGSRPQ